MKNLDDLYRIPPYSLPREKKRAVLCEYLTELTERHRATCRPYANVLRGVGYEKGAAASPEDVPFIPVRLFKAYDLMSVPREEIVKVLTSSGTSGQSVSKVYLDRQNVRDQTRVLAEIISSYIGGSRRPLLLLDTEMVKKDRSMFSARGAGIIGFSTFGRNITYALDSEMKPDIAKILVFLKAHQGERILLFGYTYMIWQYLVVELEKRGIQLPISQGTLFHIGGWKKLRDLAVGREEFNARLNAVLGGNVDIYNYYGMAEQLGSVFVECEHGHMHCSNYSDIIIRRAADFSPAEIGESGLIELLSLLPSSYPGHALLTEDEGVLLGEDDCPCGRMGKYFRIIGRIKGAEIRGCSDTYDRH